MSCAHPLAARLQQLLLCALTSPPRVQGNCAGAPAATFTGGAAREPLKPRQCVVAARRSAFRVFSEKLWVDNLLTLWTEPRDGGVAPEERPGHALWDINTPTDIGKVDGRSVYITNATFEGPSTAHIRPMQVWQASAVMLQGVATGEQPPDVLYDFTSDFVERSPPPGGCVSHTLS